MGEGGTCDGVLGGKARVRRVTGWRGCRWKREEGERDRVRTMMMPGWTGENWQIGKFSLEMKKKKQKR